MAERTGHPGLSLAAVAVPVAGVVGRSPPASPSAVTVGPNTDDHLLHMACNSYIIAAG
ncbi:hypothetical protein GCM10009680_64890 [Streptomyces yatensis]|uniref:Secreted protein n=1 Tax=Streptomyces yatensis TaxID=155177 RepID=A0ABN2IZ05_9ACTN